MFTKLSCYTTNLKDDRQNIYKRLYLRNIDYAYISLFLCSYTLEWPKIRKTISLMKYESQMEYQDGYTKRSDTNSGGKKPNPLGYPNRGCQKVATPILKYGSESWIMSDTNKRKVTSTEMRFPKIEGKTRMDKVLSINVATDKMEEEQHVGSRCQTTYCPILCIKLNL